MSEQNFKAFELKVKPDEYGDLNKPLPDTVPKPNVGCGIRNDECFGLIFAWIVAPEEAMDYDSVEDTVKDVRLSLMENMGLLECKNGLTAKGHKYESGCELFKKRIECAIMIKVAENQELAAQGIEVPIELGTTCNACADGEACE